LLILLPCHPLYIPALFPVDPS